MQRFRTGYPADDSEWMEIGSVTSLRVRILGIPLHPMLAMFGVIGIVALMSALVFISRRSWFPDGPIAGWTVVAICALLLLLVAYICVKSLLSLARALHRVRMQMAKLDGATEQEAQAETRTFLIRNVFLKMAIFGPATVVIYILLGSPWRFAWAGLPHYLAAMLTLVVIFMIITVFGARIANAIRRLTGRRN